MSCSPTAISKDVLSPRKTHLYEAVLSITSPSTQPQEATKVASVSVGASSGHFTHGVYGGDLSWLLSSVEHVVQVYSCWSIYQHFILFAAK